MSVLIYIYKVFDVDPSIETMGVFLDYPKHFIKYGIKHAAE